VGGGGERAAGDTDQMAAVVRWSLVVERNNWATRWGRNYLANCNVGVQARERQNCLLAHEGTKIYQYFQIKLWFIYDNFFRWRQSNSYRLYTPDWNMWFPVKRLQWSRILLENLMIAQLQVFSLLWNQSIYHRRHKNESLGSSVRTESR
jgi:hypothetical protein